VLRREILRAGALTAFGVGLGHLARRRALASASPANGRSARARSCILVWLDGGPSHIDTFDPKIDAPREVRGPFRTTPTRIPGTHFSELLPKTAALADRIAVVRSLTSSLGEHNFASQHLLTAHPPSPSLEHPALGSLVSHGDTRKLDLPPYAAVGDAPNNAAGAGFLGPEHAPFVIDGDPARPEFRVRDLELYPGVTRKRLERRRSFLEAIDQLARDADAKASSADASIPDGSRFDEAFRLVTSGVLRDACDLSKEPREMRERYGTRTLGLSCLMARRLVERGVPFVTVTDRGWDTHEDGVLRLAEGYTGGKVGKIPVLDLAFSALLGDLGDRGLLDETLIVVAGEFGRTPKVNTQGGRDHWPRVFSAVLAGAGIAPGVIVGASDALGESPSDRPISPPDLGATVLSLLGLDPAGELTTPDGRPVRRTAEGRPIAEILA